MDDDCSKGLKFDASQSDAAKKINKELRTGTSDGAGRYVGGMILSDWRPMHHPVDIAILGKTAEEAGELVSAASRCLIQGIHGNEPVTGKPNQEWLEDELADVRAQDAMLCARFNLNEERIVARTKRKIMHKQAWHSYLEGTRFRNLLLIKRDGRYCCDEPKVPGSPPAGYGDTPEEAFADWFVIHQESLGVKIDIADSAR